MRYIIALIRNGISHKKRKKLYEKAVIAESLINAKINSGELKWPDPNAWKAEHPESGIIIPEFIENIKKSMIKQDTIGFGDSLLAAMKNYSIEIKTKYNFAVGGMWAHHIGQMIGCIVPLLKKYKYQHIKYIVIGSLGGNPFLQRQPIDITVRMSLGTLNYSRKEFPRSKIIVYGLPPTICAYANSMSLKFESALYEWVVKDGNAVFLPLHKKFSRIPAWLYLLQNIIGNSIFYPPKMRMTLEGIHMSHLGKYHFEKLIRKGKKAQPGRMID